MVYVLDKHKKPSGQQDILTSKTVPESESVRVYRQNTAVQYKGPTVGNTKGGKPRFLPTAKAGDFRAAVW